MLLLWLAFMGLQVGKSFMQRCTPGYIALYAVQVCYIVGCGREFVLVGVFACARLQGGQPAFTDLSEHGIK